MIQMFLCRIGSCVETQKSGGFRAEVPSQCEKTPQWEHGFCLDRGKNEDIWPAKIGLDGLVSKSWEQKQGLNHVEPIPLEPKSLCIVFGCVWSTPILPEIRLEVEITFFYIPINIIFQNVMFLFPACFKQPLPRQRCRSRCCHRCHRHAQVSWDQKSIRTCWVCSHICCVV